MQFHHEPQRGKNLASGETAPTGGTMPAALEILAAIPEADRNLLDSFLRELVRDKFAFTLFGNKPVSTFTGLAAPGLNEYQAGWDAFTRNRTCFPDTYFSLRLHSDDERYGWRLINKEACRQIFKANDKIIARIMGQAIDIEKLLPRMEEASLMVNALADSITLAGLFFGHGLRNSLFYEYAYHLRYSDKEQAEKQRDLLVELGEDPARVSELKNWRRGIWQPSDDTRAESPLLDPYDLSVKLQSFSGFPDDLETKALIRSYILRLPELNQICQSEKFLEQLVVRWQQGPQA